MRNLKKALSLALASVMLLGMMVVGTSADFTDVEATHNVEAIEVLEAVGVMIGDNGKFNPEKAVTRNEMAVIMTNLLDLNPADYSGTSPFTDVPAWAEPYVAAVYANGITGGISATEYGGDNGLTAAQAALMVMKALGYFQYASDFGSDWQLATVKQADKIDLFKGINSKVTATLTRNEAAQMVLNALQATMVDSIGADGVKVEGEGFTVTTGSTVQYVPVTKSGSNAISADTYNSVTTVELGEDLFAGKLILDNSGEYDAFGRAAKDWYYGTAVPADLIGTYTTADVLAYSTEANAVENGEVYAMFGAVPALDIYENGNDSGADTAAITSADKGGETAIAAFANYEGAMVEYVDQDNDGDPDRVCVSYGLLAKVTGVTEATASADRKINLTVYNDNAVSPTNATITGYECDEFEEDDYVIVYANDTIANTEADTVIAPANVIKVEAAQSVTGKVTAYTGSTAAKANVTALSIAGTSYPTAGATYLMLNYVTPTVNSGEYVAYLLNGTIIGLEGKGATADLSDIVYATSDAYSSVNTNGDLMWYIKVIDMTGVSKVISTKNSLSGLLDDTFYIVGSDSNGATLTAAANNQKIVPGYAAMDTAAEKIAVDALAGQAFTADTKIVTFQDGANADKKAHVDANTVYIFENGDKTTAVTGTLVKTLSAGTTALVVKDANNEPYIPVVLVANSTYSATVATDILYVASNTVKGGGHDGENPFYTYEAYDLTGTKVTFNSLSSSISNAGNFVSFEKDEDGYYTLTNLTATEYAHYYTYTGNSSAAVTMTKLGTALTLDYAVNADDLTDVEAANAVILDLDGAKDVTSLTKLVAATGFEGAILLDKDDNVRMIVVTDMDKTA